MSEIGSIIFSDILNEREVSNKINRYSPKHIGECKIEVYNGEGTIPHFHIFNLDKKFESCVRIYDANFFSHGGKYKGILNSSQCRELDSWLRKINAFDKTKTNWEYIESLWNNYNPNCLYPTNLKTILQPDYSTMNKFKEDI